MGGRAKTFVYEAECWRWRRSTRMGNGVWRILSCWRGNRFSDGNKTRTRRIRAGFYGASASRTFVRSGVVWLRWLLRSKPASSASPIAALRWKRSLIQSESKDRTSRARTMRFSGSLNCAFPTFTKTRRTSARSADRAIIAPVATPQKRSSQVFSRSIA